MKIIFPTSYKISQIKYWIKGRMISVAFCCRLAEVIFLLCCCFYSLVSIATGSIPTSLADLCISGPHPRFCFGAFFNFFFFVFFCSVLSLRNIFDVAEGKNISWKIVCSNCLWIGTEPRLSLNAAGKCWVQARYTNLPRLGLKGFASCR